MSVPTLCIYSNEDPHVLLYNGKVEKKHMDDVEKVINSPKWKVMNTSIVRIDYDLDIQFFCRTTAKYVYIMISSNGYSSKIYELIDKINNFVELRSIKNFNSYAKNFDEMISTFAEQENKIGKIQSQINDITDTMTNTIAVTLDRQDKIINLEEKTNDLRNSAKNFERGSFVLKRNMQCRNLKMILVIAFVIILVITIIIVIATQ